MKSKTKKKKQKEIIPADTDSSHRSKSFGWNARRQRQKRRSGLSQTAGKARDTPRKIEFIPRTARKKDGVRRTVPSLPISLGVELPCVAQQFFDQPYKNKNQRKINKSRDESLPSLSSHLSSKKQPFLSRFPKASKRRRL